MFDQTMQKFGSKKKRERQRPLLSPPPFMARGQQLVLVLRRLIIRLR